MIDDDLGAASDASLATRPGDVVVSTLENVGLASRLTRLRIASRGLVLALDDRLSSGPIGTLSDLQALRAAVREASCEAIMAFPGTLKAFSTAAGWRPTAQIMNVNAGTTMGAERVRRGVFGIEQVVAADAVAACFHLNVGAPEEPEQLRELGDYVCAAHRYGMPMMVAAYPRPDRVTTLTDRTHVLHAAIVATELGADIVKFPFTDDIVTLTALRAAVPGPTMLLMAGGEKKSADDLRAAAVMVTDVGLDGLCLGRSFFLDPDSPATMRRLRTILRG